MTTREGYRCRLDEALVERGLAPSRSRARDMIARGTVSIDGARESKPARLVGATQEITADDAAASYVSRAAVKLLAGLAAFQFDPAGLTALDLGASTGGFTQVLLERGAARVVAIDVGRNEMDRSLVSDPRVTSLAGVNVRDLTRDHLGGLRAGALVADLSFISLKLALPAALALAEEGAWAMLLVKPQFEVGRKALGKGGIVRDAAAAEASAESVAAWIGTLGWRVLGLRPSPIAGGSGNREFLLGAEKDGAAGG